MVWLDRSQVDLAAAIARGARVTLAGAGSPVKGASGGVAASLGCPPFDDLRAALASAECDLVLLLTLGDFGNAPTGVDAASLLAARARAVKVASLEPVPSSALDLAGAAWTVEGAPGPADAVRFVGLPRLARPMREAAEVLASLGPVRGAHIDSFAGPGEGSLAARLFAGIDLLASVMGEPESVDAAHVCAAFHQGARTPPGETLAGLDGDLAVVCRYADGRAASLAASNHAGRWNFTATLLGENGRLRLYDDGFEWVGVDGLKRDELRIRRAARGDANATGHGAAAIAESVARLLDESTPETGRVQLESVLAVGQAVLLSARTGQPESPATIRRMITPSA